LTELIVVVAGVALMPRGVFDRRVARSILLSMLSGGAMALAAFGTRTFGPFLSAPIAVLTYGVAAWVTGAIEPEQIAAVGALVKRRMLRFRRAPSRD
jgi:hypothetical protein